MRSYAGHGRITRKSLNGVPRPVIYEVRSLPVLRAGLRVQPAGSFLFARDPGPVFLGRATSNSRKVLCLLNQVKQNENTL